MANPLYQIMSGQQMPNNNDFINRFNQFRNNFKGDPRKQVQDMLNSGRISQEQYNYAVQMANQFHKFLGK